MRRGGFPDHRDQLKILQKAPINQKNQNHRVLLKTQRRIRIHLTLPNHLREKTGKMLTPRNPWHRLPNQRKRVTIRNPNKLSSNGFAESLTIQVDYCVANFS